MSRPPCTRASPTGSVKHPQRGQGHRSQVHLGVAGADRRQEGARAGPQPQEPARRWRSARKAGGLPVTQPGRVRGLHRRGRLRRRPGETGTQPEDPGDPPDPREDPECREGAHRPGPGKPGGAGDHLGARHRRPGRFRHRQTQISQDRADGRCRCRRPAHPHTAADTAVPLHAAAGRGRFRLPRTATAVPAEVDAGRRTTTSTPTSSAMRLDPARPRERPEAAEGGWHPAVQGPR